LLFAYILQQIHAETSIAELKVDLKCFSYFQPVSHFNV